MMNIRFFFTFHFGQSIWCYWVTRTWNTTHPAVITDDDCVGCWAGTLCSKPIPYSQLCKSGVAISQLIHFFLYSIKITLNWYVGVLCYEHPFQVKRLLKISIKSVSSPRGSSKCGTVRERLFDEACTSMAISSTEDCPGKTCSPSEWQAT